MAKKKEKKTSNILGLFSIVATTDKDADMEDFLKRETEWMGEPTTPTGCIITMRLKEWGLLKNGKPTLEGYQDKKDGITEKKAESLQPKDPEGHLYFHFRGVQFDIDLLNLNVKASGRPFDSEVQKVEGEPDKFMFPLKAKLIK